MDLLADRGRRVPSRSSIPARLLAHARKQAHERNLDDMLIADVDSHHYENECFDEFLPFIENDVLRQLVLAGRAKGRQTLTPSQVSFQDMGGRITRYPLRSSEKTASRQDARRRTGPSLDGRDERRLFLPVSDHAARGRAASVDRNGDRAVLGLQPLAHREGAAGKRRAALLDAVAADLRSRRGAAPDRDVRRLQARHRFSGDLGAHLADPSQFQHEGVPRHRGARAGARVPLRRQYRRAGVQGPQPLRRRCTRSASRSSTSCT